VTSPSRFGGANMPRAVQRQYADAGACTRLRRCRM
jgi:hypothetical protein